jgi:hypothetical protein
VTAGGHGGSHYDEADLKRRIAVSFSAGELSRFAERLGVMLDREGDPAGGARALVRSMGLRKELDRLVDLLREAKPLVEWPDPLPDERPAPSSKDPSTPFAPSAPQGAALSLDSPGSLGPAGGITPSAPAPSSPSPPGTSAPGRSAPAPHASDPGLLADPYLRPEPAAAPPWRWIALGAVATALLVATGLGIWVLSRDAPAEQQQGVAVLAAQELRNTIDAIAKTCAATEGSSARDRLADAFRRCSGVPRIRPGLDLTPPIQPTPAPAAPAGAPVPRGDRPKPESTCPDRCHALQTQCQESECGPEPRSAEKYVDYQRCLGECLQKASRCRLSCR